MPAIFLRAAPLAGACRAGRVGESAFPVLDEAARGAMRGFSSIYLTWCARPSNEIRSRCTHVGPVCCAACVTFGRHWRARYLVCAALSEERARAVKSSGDAGLPPMTEKRTAASAVFCFRNARSVRWHLARCFVPDAIEMAGPACACRIAPRVADSCERNRTAHRRSLRAPRRACGTDSEVSRQLCAGSHGTDFGAAGPVNPL